MARSPLSTTLRVVTLMAGLWAALGYARNNDVASASSIDNNSPFVLRTQVKNGGDAKFDDLYVFAYHTGAGLNDAMLRPEAHAAVPASAYTGGAGSGSSLGARFFAVQFHIGGSPYQLMPSTGVTPYPGLQPVRINVNGAPPEADNAFYFDGNKLMWTSSAESSPPGGFAGWLACQSDHPAVGAPTVKGTQLFYRTTPGPTPAGCADVDLEAVY
ncbi:MAG: hypothetical protein STHCBS139747_004305 [Sporothrix thermara]